MRLGDTLKVLSLNPLWRIKRHADYLRGRVDIPDEADRKSFENVHAAVDGAISKLRVYYWVRFALFVLLYISAVAAVAKTLDPLFLRILEPIRSVVAFFGVGIISVLVLLMTKLISAVMEDLRTAHAHMVALAVKHNDGVVHPEHKWGLFMRYQ